ncbi:(2Fe-2S)-binding protein [Aequoribacter sp.]|jgi:aerobic-type carbon monoxide dehydrogenase small subunit (CoxS/CutS family)|uniref:(2Fe-2S)-binding protein n=1 Tax=Aequoribacter sp. TaxID=2847771 RepID=UPI003F699583
MPNYTLTVNNKQITVDVDADTPMLWVLRDSLNLLGTKFGCGAGACGACTIHLNDSAVRSCQIPVSAVGDMSITTIEGLATDIGTKHPVQQAWLDLDVAQCGYCQAGQIMNASSLLANNPNPTDQDIDNAMQGNLCRCGTYVRIREAVKLAATQMKAEA